MSQYFHRFIFREYGSVNSVIPVMRITRTAILAFHTSDEAIMRAFVKPIRELAAKFIKSCQTSVRVDKMAGWINGARWARYNAGAAVITGIHAPDRQPCGVVARDIGNI